jgi:6-pyruvoyltetrahydropterin/6-carboxytetrahydropterin synthase
MYYLKSEVAFDSAHFLSDYDGKCKNLHGHRWRVVAEIKSETLSSEKQTNGMVIDFSDLKSALKGICDDLDHSLIYEEGSLKSKTIEALIDENFKLIPVPFRPTAENFAKHFFDLLKNKGFNVNKVEVYETPNNSVVYSV